MTTTATINALVAQLAADATRIAGQATDAASQMEVGNRNGAIGALLTVEAEVGRLQGIFTTILTLHRSP